MDYLQQVQRGVDFIEANLDEDLAISSVARRAGLSTWHFQRIFKSLTHETLKSYIRSRRFALALDRLVDSDKRILEVALASGFDTQESFTRAFKKAFGATPAQVRKTKPRFPFPRQIRFDAEYLQHLHHNVSLEPVLYQQPAMQLVGLRTRFFGVDSEKNNLARKLPPLWDALIARAGEIEGRVPNVFYGVVRQTAAGEGELEYDAAAEVRGTPRLPRGMVAFAFPGAQYAKFTHLGPSPEVDLTVSYIYSTWLIRSGLRHTCAPDLERYDQRYHPTAPESVIEYAIPVA